MRDLDPDDRYDIPWHRQESDGQMHDFSALLILINIVPFVVAVVGCVSVVFFHRHTIKKHVTRHAVLLRAKTRVLPRRLSLAPQQARTPILKPADLRSWKVTEEEEPSKEGP